ncbi:MAG: hypothetical protein V4490_05960 [Pseudomonadota bacterium]
MVKLLFITSALILSGCSSSDHETTTKQKSPGNVLSIESIKIEHNGEFSNYISSDETPEMCKSFVLDKADVLNFFTTARSATSREYEHDLTASNCFASGTFISNSGVSGDWKVDRSRRGTLHVQGKAPEYYYCNECKSQLFYEACDIDCAHGE